MQERSEEGRCAYEAAEQGGCSHRRQQRNRPRDGVRIQGERARVVIFGRSRRTLDQAAESLGGDVLPVQGDVRSLGDLERLFEQTAQRFGKIDVLVANAGIAKFAPVEVLSEALFDELSDTLFKGVFFTAQKALPHLRDGASIILVGSADGTSRAGSARRSTPRANRLCVPLRAPCALNFFPATFASMCSARA